MEELASMLELTYSPEDMLDITPEAVEWLRRGTEFLAERKAAPPASVALVNLRIARFNAGLPDVAGD